MKEALGYFLAVTAAELITAVGQPVLGIFAHIIILMAVILRSALAGRQPQQQLLLSLALVPLVRIISLSMPLANIPQAWWYPVIYTPLLVAGVVVIRILNFSAGDVGVAFRLLPLQLIVALSGLIFGVAEYLILKPETMIAELTWQGIWLPAVILLVTTGFVEEFIFRGVLQRTALEAFGGRGIVYVSLLFAVLHMGFLSWIDVAFVFVVALFFGWIVKKTGSLLGVTLAHGITNIILFLVAPFFF
ncbi:MAG: CPBP family intramembrane metalloprotease [Chloroflexi bacterium]|nr:CPBP family intramembrane metalloprotease [Chloroflexota bacterium]